MVVVVVGVTFGQRNVKSGYDNKPKQKVVNLGENRKPTATMWQLFYLGGVDLVVIYAIFYRLFKGKMKK